MLNNFILNLFYSLLPARECAHNKVSPASDGEYCPDCGKYVVNEWYIARCKCCGVKLQTIEKNGSIVPSENFCHNCGGCDYRIEQLSKIDFINIHYAVLIKHALGAEAPIYSTQCWQDDAPNIAGLLPFIRRVR